MTGASSGGEDLKASGPKRLSDPLQAIQSRQLVFIVGAPRSGTTWLQLLLSQHPAVASCQETHLFSSYLDGLLSTPENAARSSRSVGLSNILGNEAYTAWVRRIAAEGLCMAVPIDQSTQIIVEKTPQHISCSSSIHALFPEAFFLEMVRDPRAVVASMQAMAQSDTHWVRNSPLSNAYWWRDCIEAGERLAGLTDRHMRVRYEDLHEDAGAIVQRVFDFLGFPIEDAVARDFAEAVSFRRLQRGASRKTPWDPSADPAGFYRKGAVASWKGDLSKKDIALIEGVTRDRMMPFGYRPITRRRWSVRLAYYRILSALHWRTAKRLKRL